MTELVEVGRIVKPHGLAGEVVVELLTDREERLEVGGRLQADRAGRRDELVVARARKQRPASERRRARWIVHFRGHSDIDVAEQWRGVVLLAEPLAEPDVLWVDDLVGTEVVLASDGSRVGECVAVLANPAADLLELDDGSLVPVVFVVDRSPDRVVIDPPAGLLDL